MVLQNARMVMVGTIIATSVDESHHRMDVSDKRRVVPARFLQGEKGKPKHQSVEGALRFYGIEQRHRANDTKHNPNASNQEQPSSGVSLRDDRGTDNRGVYWNHKIQENGGVPNIPCLDFRKDELWADVCVSRDLDQRPNQFRKV